MILQTPPTKTFSVFDTKMPLTGDPGLEHPAAVNSGRLVCVSRQARRGQALPRSELVDSHLTS